MSEPAKPDHTAALAVGGLALVAAGVAVAALLAAPKPEGPDELVDRLVENALRRGDAQRPWYAVVGN
jgi:hypothetical protein